MNAARRRGRYGACSASAVNGMSRSTAREALVERPRWGKSQKWEKERQEEREKLIAVLRANPLRVDAQHGDRMCPCAKAEKLKIDHHTFYKSREKMRAHRET